MASNGVESLAAPAEEGNSAAASSADPRPYKCKVEVTFASPDQAKHAMDVLSVDGELGDKVVKNFALIPAEDGSEGDVILRV